MEAAHIGLVAVDEYLSGERHSEVRHEYVAGSVFAMAGASEAHNDLCGNLYTALRNYLRNSPCKVFMVDMKVRFAVGRESVFYYPDVLVTCDPRDTDKYFKRYPKVIIEVLSPETERTDRREKFLAYSGIETFDEYVLVSQERMEVTVLRRATQWQPEVITAPNDNLALAPLNFSIALADVYEGVKV